MAFRFFLQSYVKEPFKVRRELLRSSLNEIEGVSEIWIYDNLFLDWQCLFIKPRAKVAKNLQPSPKRILSYAIWRPSSKLCDVIALEIFRYNSCNESQRSLKTPFSVTQLYLIYWSPGATMIWWPNFICLLLSTSTIEWDPPFYIKPLIEYSKTSSGWYSPIRSFLRLYFAFNSTTSNQCWNLNALYCTF